MNATKNEENKESYKIWKRVFGRSFPSAKEMGETTTVKKMLYVNTEQFIEDKYQIDIRYRMNIECSVSQKGFQTRLLRMILAMNFP